MLWLPLKVAQMLFKSQAQKAVQENRPKLRNRISNLKSLIIKSAHTVRSEVETLEKSLQSTYVAISDFGTFQEDITGKFEATAASLSQTIDYYATLNDKLGSVSNEFDTYVIDVEGYIRQGIIGYDGAIPIIGIAIGRDLTVTGTQETVNGKTYDVIDTSSNMSVWTPDKLAFYVNGAEIAYFSNGALYVNAVIVQERLVIGHNKWLIDHSNGLTIRWIGG